MNTDINAEETDHVKMKCGETIKMESLKKAVTPPFLMVIPFIELPAFIELLRQDSLEGEGVQGCTFVIKALEQGKGIIVTGFKDLRAGTALIEKSISVEVVQ